MSLDRECSRTPMSLDRDYSRDYSRTPTSLDRNKRHRTAQYTRMSIANGTGQPDVDRTISQNGTGHPNVDHADRATTGPEA